MRKYRVVMVEEFDDSSYRKAAWYQVQKRSLIPWLWLHVKFYDEREGAMYHVARAEAVQGKSRRKTVISS